MLNMYDQIPLVKYGGGSNMRELANLLVSVDKWLRANNKSPIITIFVRVGV